MAEPTSAERRCLNCGQPFAEHGVALPEPYTVEVDDDGRAFVRDAIVFCWTGDDPDMSQTFRAEPLPDDGS